MHKKNNTVEPALSDTPTIYEKTAVKGRLPFKGGVMVDSRSTENTMPTNGSCNSDLTPIMACFLNTRDT